MENFERPLMGLALAFCVIMLVFGWGTVAYVGWIPGLIMTATFGTLAVSAAVWGWRQQSPYWVGAGAVGAGVLFPTVAGIVPMIIGVVLLILLATLRLFNQMSQGQ